MQNGEGWEGWGGGGGGGAGINKMCYGNVKVANITGLPLFVTKAKARISIPVFNSWTQNYQKVFFLGFLKVFDQIISSTAKNKNDLTKRIKFLVLIVKSEKSPAFLKQKYK